MANSTPVTILGGYLGAGKTTLVNHLLRNANGLRIAVMVNDFGDLPIDASLIESTEGDVINLSGGCVCCSYGNDLTLALMQLGSMPTKPEHIVIEASGVALPGAIAGSLSLLPNFDLDGVVVLADAHSVKAQSTERYISDTIVRQLNDADLIVLNKIDEINSSQLKELRTWMSASYPNRPVLTSVNAEVATNVILGVDSVRAQVTSTNRAYHAEGFQSIELNPPSPVDVSLLTKKLADSRFNLMRVKGFAKDLDGRRKTIQIVGNRSRITDAPDDAKDGIVCIGRNEDMQRFNNIVQDDSFFT